MSAAEFKALRALRMLYGIRDLGDFVYDIRNSELLGWEGPQVKQWSDACTLAREAMLEAGLDPLRPPTAAPMHRTRWQCERCDAEGVIEYPEGSVVYEIIARLTDAHTEANATCSNNEGLNKVSVTPEPAR